MIEVKNLSKEFKIYKKDPGLLGSLKSIIKRKVEIKKAVDNISFNIDKGEIIGYIGPNGAGKSTTIKMMTGILVPSSGKCLVNGVVPYEDRMKNAMDIGVVFGQRTQLWWDLPLIETFSILKEIYEVSDKDFKNRMEFLNEVLDIPKFISNPVRTLSLGQRMRADLAASLIHNPKILYLDEPTIGLDVLVKEKMRDAIKTINKEYKTTVILTTHDMYDIEELCSRMIIIDNGKKIYDGGIEEIKTKYGNIRTVNFEVKKEKKIDFIEEFNLSKDDMQVSYSSDKLKIRYNKDKIKLPQILNKVMSEIDIHDMTIEETSIDDIIKKIYNSGVN